MIAATRSEEILPLSAPAAGGLRVAWMMSRFPKITETFILYEMLAAEKSGVQVEVFPLRRERVQKMHPEAARFVERAHFLPCLSMEILRDNLNILLTRPLLWLGTLWTIIRANLGSRRFLAGALAVFPMCVTMARRMRAAGIDHIHAHFASHPAAAAWMIHRFSGIPYSFTAHGSDLHRDRHMLREKVADAAFVVAISQYNRAIILNETGASFENRIAVIHCGVNPEDFAATTPQTAQPPDDVLNVICIGTLHEVKGQKYLIDAVATLVRRNVRIRLQLVGDGPDQEKLQQQVVDEGLRQHVVFEGRRDRHEIIELLRSADILVAPSVPTADGRREGIPVVLMEAMASGLPVISSRLSGIPELVRHEVNGLLTEPGDSQALARELLRLSRDAALRNALGAAGRRTICEEFDLDSSVRQIVSKIRQTRPWMSVVRPLAACHARQARENEEREVAIR